MNKKRRCGHCKTYKEQNKGVVIGLSFFCDKDCMFKKAIKTTEKLNSKKVAEEKKEWRKKKQEIKTRSEWQKHLERVFNRYIVLRDKDLPCVSCGRTHVEEWHAGHFIAVGNCLPLRFLEINVHKQCSRCNTHLRGNLLPYQDELINRIGEHDVNWLRNFESLKQEDKPMKLTIPDMQASIKKYNSLNLELNKR